MAERPAHNGRPHQRLAERQRASSARQDAIQRQTVDEVAGIDRLLLIAIVATVGNASDQFKDG